MLVILVSEIVTKKQSHFWQEFLYSVQNYEIIGIEKAKKPAIRVLCFLLTVVNRNETRSYETERSSYETLTLRNGAELLRNTSLRKRKRKRKPKPKPKRKRNAELRNTSLRERERERNTSLRNAKLRNAELRNVAGATTLTGTLSIVS